MTALPARPASVRRGPGSIARATPEQRRRRALSTAYSQLRRAEAAGDVRRFEAIAKRILSDLGYHPVPATWDGGAR